MNSIILSCVLCLTIFSSTLLSADTSESRRKQLLSLIDEELREVVKLTKQTRGKDPEIILRRAELYLEKARLLQESENESFLAIPPEKRSSVNSKSYFAHSNQNFGLAQKTCEFMLQNFPRFKGRAHVLYIMAFNAKEMRQDQKAKKYFEESIATSDKRSKVYAKSSMALAELYFNEGEHAKAIPLYEDALAQEKSKWWTKDTYNLAWAYFRTKQKSKAIDTMRVVYDSSSNTKYIDMKKQASRDLAFFYTDAGRIEEAVAFYKSVGVNASENLHLTAKLLIDQGKTTMAEEILEEALKAATTDKDQVKIQMTLLNIYDRFGNFEKHLNTSNLLVSKLSALDDTNRELLIFQIKKSAGVLQKQVVNKHYQHNQKQKELKTNWAAGYFTLLTTISPSENFIYNFHAGETYFSAEMYSLAVAKYKMANEQAKAAGNKKYEELSLNGLMASMGKGGVENAVGDDVLVDVYLKYLAANPRTAESDKIYQRLFNLYYQAKNITKAEETLISYRKNFPDAISTQEAMLTRVMDYYKNAGDRKSMEKWAARIQQGEFKVNQNLARKIQVYLLSSRFEGVEKAASQGEKKKALQLYYQIYKEETTNNEAKQNAAYNLATLFYQLRDVKRTHEWAIRSLDIMADDNLQKLESEYMTIAADLFNRRKLAEAESVYRKLFEKGCNRDGKFKSSIFKNIVVIDLAMDELDKAKAFIKHDSFTCKVPLKLVEEAQVDYMMTLSETKRWNSNKGELDELAKSKNLIPDLVVPYNELREELLRSGQEEMARSIGSKIFSMTKDIKKEELSLEALDVIAEIRLQKVDSLISALYEVQLEFPEATYNVRLKKMLSQLDTITKEILEVMNIGSGRGIVKCYKRLIPVYDHVIKSVEGFRPEGKSPEYIASFSGAMAKLTVPVREQMTKFKLEAKESILKNEILSKESATFMVDAALPFSPQYEYKKAGVLMDRGGRR